MCRRSLRVAFFIEESNTLPRDAHAHWVVVLLEYVGHPGQLLEAVSKVDYMNTLELVGGVVLHAALEKLPRHPTRITWGVAVNVTEPLCKFALGVTGALALYLCVVI